MIDLAKLRPIDDKVLVQLDPQRFKSDGGLYILDNPLRPVNTGKVLAKGPRADWAIKEGSHVFFDVTCIAIDAESDALRLLPSNGILAILEPCS